MRTLSTGAGGLETAQQAQSATPEITLDFSSRDGVTTLSYKISDSTNRIMRVRTAEGMYGGMLFEVAAPNGDIVPIAAQIILNNSDNEFSSKDLRGYKVIIGWGFKNYVDGSGATVTVSGTNVSKGEPYFVWNQRENSSPGANQTELWCISAWYFLELRKILGDTVGTNYTTDRRKIRHVIWDALMSEASAVVTEDNSLSSFNDISSLVDDYVSSPGGSEDDSGVLLMDNNDALYIGAANDANAAFDRVTIELNTEGVGSYDYTFEYSKGSGTWGTLTGVIDGTDNLKDSSDAGANQVPVVFSFARPSDWSANTVDSKSRLWIRFRITTTGLTTAPKILRLGIQRHWALEVSSVDNIENSSTNLPNLAYPFDATRGRLVRELLDRTKSAMVMTETHFKMLIFADSPVSTDYDYDLGGTHTFFTDVREQTLVIPNEIVAINVADDSPLTQIVGTAAGDSDSQSDMGIVLEIIADPEILTVQEATNRASRRLNRYKQEVYQGEVVVPMNVGQEPWDWIGVTDDRISKTITGRVGKLIREYSQQDATYRLNISMGILRAASIDFIGTSPDLPDTAPIIIPFLDTSPDLPQLEQGRGFIERVRGQMEALGATRLQGESRILPRETLAHRLGVQGPNEALGRGLPFWFGLVPQTAGYNPTKQNAAATLGGDFHEVIASIVQLRDFQAGGYNKVSMLNNGDGTISIENAGAKTDVETLLYNMNMELKQLSSVVAELRLRELTANGSHYTGFKSPDSLAASVLYTLPTADGSSGQVLNTNGSKVLSWSTAKVSWQNVVIVDAAGGGDETDIQTAIDNVSGESITNKFLILINGGDYTKSGLTMKAHVYLQGRGINTTRILLTNSSGGAIVGIEDSGIADLTLFGNSTSTNFTVKVADGINRWRCDNVYMHGKFDLAGGNYNDCAFTGDVQVGGTDETFPPTFTNPQFGYLPSLTSTNTIIRSASGDYAYINGGYVYVNDVGTDVDVKYTGVTFIFAGGSVTFDAEGSFDGCGFFRAADNATEAEIKSPRGSFSSCLFRDVLFKATMATGPVNLSGCHVMSTTSSNDPILLPATTPAFPMIISGTILENTAGGTVIGKANTTGSPMLELNGNTYRGTIDANVIASARLRGTDVQAEFFPVSMSAINDGGTAGAEALVGAHPVMELNGTDQCFIPLRLSPPVDVRNIVDMLLVVSGEFDLATDTFTEGSNTTLGSHTADTGETWTEVTGSHTVRASDDRVTGDATALATFSVGATDGFLRAKFHIISAGANQALIFRYSDSSNYWRIQTTGSTEISLIKKVANSDTVIARFETGGGNNTFVLGASFFGNDIKVYMIEDGGGFDELLLFETNDSFNNTATTVGLAAQSTDASAGMDDFNFYRGDSTADLTVSLEGGPENAPLAMYTDSLTITNTPIAHQVTSYIDIKALMETGSLAIMEGSMVGVKVLLGSVGSVNTAIRVHGILLRGLPSSKLVRSSQSATASLGARQVVYR